MRITKIKYSDPKILGTDKKSLIFLQIVGQVIEVVQIVSILYFKDTCMKLFSYNPFPSQYKPHTLEKFEINFLNAIIKKIFI
jgi:hypothetical protein